MYKKIIKKPIFDRGTFLIKTFIDEEIKKIGLELNNSDFSGNNDFDNFRDIGSIEKQIKGLQNLSENLKIEKANLLQKNENLQKEIEEKQNFLQDLLLKISTTKGELQQIENKKNEIEEKAKKEGLKEGMDLGRIEGKQQILNKANNCLRQIESTQKLLDKKSSEFIIKEEEILKKSEGEMLKAVIIISEKIVQKISREDKGLVLHLIRQAAKKIKDVQEVNLRVNPNDYDFIAGEKNKILEIIKGVENLKIIVDEEVNPGGVVLETNEGEIDANISSQLEEIKKTLS